ncbi:MAG: M20 family metallopeptidase [bacterium]
MEDHRRGGELISSLVAIPSPNPPGNERPLALWIAAWLDRRGISSALLDFAPGRSSLAATIPGREGGVLLLSGHLDTVSPGSAGGPSSSQGWQADPYLPRIEGDQLFGLGATDMKGGVAMLLEAFVAVAERARREGPPRCSVRLLLSADEEDGYRGAAALAEAGLAEGALFTLIAEPTAGQILVGERGEFWLRASFQGKEAHGSTPALGVNAAMACARFLLAIQSKVDALPPTPLLGGATLNVGRMEGGRQVNIVPDRAQAELDIRLGSEEDKASIIASLEEEGSKAASPGRFSWETISYKRPMVTPLEDPFLRMLADAYAVVRGERPQWEAATFCTDLPTLFPAGSPAFALFGPGDIAQAHQPEEWIDLGLWEREAAVLERFLASALFP